MARLSALHLLPFSFKKRKTTGEKEKSKSVKNLKFQTYL